MTDIYLIDCQKIDLFGAPILQDSFPHIYASIRYAALLGATVRRMVILVAIPSLYQFVSKVPIGNRQSGLEAGRREKYCTARTELEASGRDLMGFPEQQRTNWRRRRISVLARFLYAALLIP